MKTLNLLNNKLLVFIFILTSFHCKAQWNAVYENDSIINLGMYFTSDSVGYVVGYRINELNYQIGHVLKTNDGGNHWDKILEGTPQTVNPASYLKYTSVFFPSANIGYVGAGYNKIMKTYDAGLTWLTLLIPYPPGIYETSLINCIDSLTCFTGKNLSFKTFNGGLNWVADTNASPLVDVSFPSHNRGYGIWSNTLDGGNNWSNPSSLPIGITSPYNCIHFVNDSLGWLGGMGSQGSPHFNYGKIAKSTDYGITWIETNFQYEMLQIRDIVFINDSVGWACGNGQSGNSRQIMKTVDGGLNWHKQFLNYTTNYSAVTQMQCLNDSLCYAISGWQIFKTTNGGGPMIGLGVNEQDNFNQLLVYPNPSKEFIKIQNQETNSAITIYNITGEIVFQTMLNQSKEINISSLEVGLYFVNCTYSKGTQTVKFIKE
jgi:photosystem II stability/assembly factor-like uncharacterized protein